MKRYILTGKRGAGKTTFCHSLFNAAVAREMTVSGLLTITRRQEELNTVNLYTRESRRLAVFNNTAFSEKHSDENKKISTDHWTFDPEAISWGNERIRMAPPSDLFILDEAGILEFKRDLGWTEGMNRIDSQKDQCTVVVVRPELINQARNRWSDSEILFIETEGLNTPQEEDFISCILGSSIQEEL